MTRFPMEDIFPDTPRQNRMQQTRLTFVAGEREIVDVRAKHLFLRTPSRLEYLQLAGASDGAQVEIGIEESRLAIEMFNPRRPAITMTMTVIHCQNDLTLQCDSLRIYGDRPTSAVRFAELLATQISGARDLGVRYLAMRPDAIKGGVLQSGSLGRVSDLGGLSINPSDWGYDQQLMFDVLPGSTSSQLFTSKYSAASRNLR